jgi:hypothetical protein
MDPIVVHSRIGADGVLQITVPIGPADAGREVDVTIKPAEPEHRKNSKQQEWRQFILETAGTWQRDLERPEQGEYERREEPQSF